MNTLRLTSERETEIRAELRKSGLVSAMNVAYLLDELDAVREERRALWTLLDNIDTLDDACREDNERFRSLAYRQQRRRFSIYNPEAHEERGGSSENGSGTTPSGNDRVVSIPKACHDFQGPPSTEHLVARTGGADPRSARELTCLHGAWEADETGVQCCVFCGVTADSGPVGLVKWKIPSSAVVDAAMCVVCGKPADVRTEPHVYSLTSRGERVCELIAKEDTQTVDMCADCLMKAGATVTRGEIPDLGSI